MKRLAAITVFVWTAVLAAGCTIPASAIAATGQITRADASADWTHGSIAGSVISLPPPTHHASFAMAYVVPNGAVCHANDFPDPNPGVTKLWESPIGDQNPSFDIPDVPLNSGISPRICLYSVYEYLFLPGEIPYPTLLASRLFTVPPPPPPPAQGTPRLVVTLSRVTALSTAKSALKKRFGNAYKLGRRKRLRCSKQSSARYLCTFSFHYEKKRQDGTVTVAIKPNGSVTTKIKRR